MTKIKSTLSGIAGEYYVAAEISRRGYLAAITLRNSDGVDILVSSLNGNKMISIQVKTTQIKKRWILNKKIESEESKNKFFVFVCLPKEITESPDYFIVRSNVLAKKIHDGHESWLNEPGKNGRIRKDSDARQFDPKYFHKDELLSWEELIEEIEVKK